MLESPNLDSLTQGRPATARALVRLLWPKIRASLDRGHTVREVQEKLRLDGIEVGYASLCRYVAGLRQSEVGERRRPANPGRDPLANVRRLTEDKPPGFQYTGTLSDKELFGK